MTVSEVCQVELWKQSQFFQLGLTPSEAIFCVDEGMDYHALESFLRQNPSCPIQTAIRIVR